MKEEKGGNGRSRNKQEKELLRIASQNVPNGAEERLGHRSFGRVGPFSFPSDSHFLVSFYMAFFHRETNVGNRPTDRQKEEGGEKRRGCNETYHWEMVSGQKGQAKRKAQEKRRDRSKFPHFISTVSSTFTLDYFAFGCITARRATRRNFVPPKRERERVVEE